MAPKKAASQEAVLDPEVGELCFFLNPKVHSWVPGVVLAWDPKAGAQCKALDSKDSMIKWQNGEVVAKLKAEEVVNVKEEIMNENVEDLLSLTVLHDCTILNVLRQRYMSDLIYTNIGAITVALNPFNFKIPCYTDDNMPKYLAEGDRIEHQIPHSWAVAHNTYWEMRNASFEPVNQCILVSGESGAGKTEASKIVMKYLACLSCKEGTQEQKNAGLAVGTKINITSPPLEAFGNAKTSRNDNSSRFGKWMQVKFDSNGFLVGADITKYLLEKSRIVTAAQGERCYHSFYVLCRATDRAKWQVSTDADPALIYANTKAGGVSANKDFDTAAEFDEVNQSLGQLGVSEDNVHAVWSVVAGIMYAENIEVEKEGEGSKVSASSQKWVDQAVSVWAIDKDTFSTELITQTLHTKEGKVVKKLTPTQALDGRSALTKTLYDNEFQWLIDTCNAMLDKESGGGRWVGLLDIFGFEDFEVNSFEQLCINLANESLQCHYNSYIFEKDMDECRAEGIDVAAVVFPDNTPCLQMVSGKGGIFAMLDEECALGQGSDLGFLDKVADKCPANAKWKPFFLKKQLAKTSFIIKHYAGDVSYEVSNFLDKNRDTLKPEYKLMIRASAVPFVASLLPAPEESGKKKTVGAFFKEQVAALMDKINSTNPHWIRCVKPHPAKKPLHFHGFTTMNQLGSSGVLGTVKIRKAGFPVRIPFAPFYQTYRVLGVGAGLDPGDLRDCACKILQAADIGAAMGQVGVSRVFLKNDAYIHLEKEKKRVLASSATVAQAWCLGLFAGRAVKEAVNEQNRGVIADLRQKIIASLAEKRAKEKAERERRAKAEREEKERQEKLRKEKERQEREQREREEMVRLVAEEEKRAKHYDSARIIQKRVRGLLARLSVTRMYLSVMRAKYEAMCERRMEQERRDAALLDDERAVHEAEHERMLDKERFKRLQQNTRQRMASLKKVAEAREHALAQVAKQQAEALQQFRAAKEAQRGEEQRAAQEAKHAEAERLRMEWDASRRRKEHRFAQRSAASDARAHGDIPEAYAHARASVGDIQAAADADSVTSLRPLPRALHARIASAGIGDARPDVGWVPRDSADLHRAAKSLLAAWRAAPSDIIDELAAGLVCPGPVESPAAVVSAAAEAAAAEASGPVGRTALRLLLQRLWQADALDTDHMCGFADVPHSGDSAARRAQYASRHQGSRNSCLRSVAAGALATGTGLRQWAKTIGVGLALAKPVSPDRVGPRRVYVPFASFADAEAVRRLRRGWSLAVLAPTLLSEARGEPPPGGRYAEVEFSGLSETIPASGGQALLLPPLSLFEVLSDGTMSTDGVVHLRLRRAAAHVVAPELVELKRLAEAELEAASTRLARVSAALSVHRRSRQLPSTNKLAVESNRQWRRQEQLLTSPERDFEAARERWGRREDWLLQREAVLSVDWEERARRRANAQTRVRLASSGDFVQPPPMGPESDEVLTPRQRAQERAVVRKLMHDVGGEF